MKNIKYRHCEPERRSNLLNGLLRPLLWSVPPGGSLMVAMTILLLIVSAVHADLVSDFSKATDAYRNGKYDEAIAGYEKIVQDGQESSALYFNLANSYFKKQELGKAIVNYERARRLTPRDTDVLANLRFARSEVVNEVIRPLNAFEKIWDAHVRFYSKNEMILAILFLFFALGAIHIVSLYWNSKHSRLILVGIAILTGIFIYGLWIKTINDKDAAIVVKSSSAHFEPNEHATVYFELPQGQSVKFREQEESWIKIERPDGKLGWVKAESIEKI